MFDVLTRSFINKWASNPEIDLTVRAMEKNVKTFSPVRQNIFAEAIVSLYGEFSRQERNLNRFLSQKFITCFVSSSCYGFLLNESADKKEIDFVVVFPSLGRAFKFQALSSYTTGSNYMLVLNGSHSAEKYKGMKPSVKTNIGNALNDVSKFKKAFGKAVLNSPEFHYELEKALNNFKNVQTRYNLRDSLKSTGIPRYKQFFILLFKNASEGKQVMIKTPMGELNAFSPELYTYDIDERGLGTPQTPKLFRCNELNLQVRYLLLHDKVIEANLNGKVISVN